MKSEGTSKKKLKKALKTSTAVVLLTTAVLSVIYRLPLCFESQNPAALAAAAFTLTNGEYKLENSKAEKPTASDQKPTESANAEPVAEKITSVTKAPITIPTATMTARTNTRLRNAP